MREMLNPTSALAGMKLDREMNGWILSFDIMKTITTIAAAKSRRRVGPVTIKPVAMAHHLCLDNLMDYGDADAPPAWRNARIRL